MSSLKNIVILGATGSIGRQAMEVIADAPGRYCALGLSANRSVTDLVSLAQVSKPRWIAISANDADQARPRGLPESIAWLVGEAGVRKMVTDADTDIVLTAVVGSAGLRATLAAVDAGKTIALANKESLVVGGSLVTELASKNGVRILPVDSEHSAIFQCLQAGKETEVARIVLTASGGPFRKTPVGDLAKVTVEQALAHPTWKMGPKITIDSATMMNKALEIIEARWLFGLSAEQISVVIHPQSQVHSMVEYVDGSVICQVSPPDMRLPIQYALSFPARTPGPAKKVDWAAPALWEFEAPDLDRFPALRLGFRVAKVGGTAGAALNAANEVAVARFLAGAIAFRSIVPLCDAVLKHHPYDVHPNLEQLERVDQWARREAEAWT